MDTPNPRRTPARPLRARATAGFTLVEIMIAAFVMLFSISSSIIVMQSGFRALDTARKTTLASQIMQSEMERIRMLSWSGVEELMTLDPNLDLTRIFPQTTETERKVLNQMERAFTTRRRVVTTLADFDHKVAQITIEIGWRGIDGVAHSRSSSTRYTDEGLYSYYVTGISDSAD
jgi:Tfp pilus assembly protein PilV